MANNEQISQEVKVEGAQPVSAENQTAKTEVKAIKVKENKRADKSKDKKKKRDKKQSRVARKLKETSSELKKVTWPKFTTVLKQTTVAVKTVEVKVKGIYNQVEPKFQDYR